MGAWGESALVLIHTQESPAPPPSLPIRGTNVTVSGNTLRVGFEFDPGTTGFVIRGSSDLAKGFPIDKTNDSTITELQPGRYEAVVDLTDEGAGFFIVIESPRR